MSKLKVALDHNLPVPIVTALADAIVEAELVPISRIDARMPRLDDDDLIHALHLRRWQVLVTCDARLVKQPRELAVILQTQMSIVVALGEGSDHVGASGLVLAHLPHVVKQYAPDEAQIWNLRVGYQRPISPWRQLEQTAKKRGVTSQSLFDQQKLSTRELARDPLAD